MTKRTKFLILTIFVFCTWIGLQQNAGAALCAQFGLTEGAICYQTNWNGDVIVNGPAPETLPEELELYGYKCNVATAGGRGANIQCHYRHCYGKCICQEPSGWCPIYCTNECTIGETKPCAVPFGMGVQRCAEGTQGCTVWLDQCEATSCNNCYYKTGTGPDAYCAPTSCGGGNCCDISTGNCTDKSGTTDSDSTGSFTYGSCTCS